MSQKCEQFSYGLFVWDFGGFGVLNGPTSCSIYKMNSRTHSPKRATFKQTQGAFLSGRWCCGKHPIQHSTAPLAQEHLQSADRHWCTSQVQQWDGGGTAGHSQYYIPLHNWLKNTYNQITDIEAHAKSYDGKAVVLRKTPNTKLNWTIGSREPSIGRPALKHTPDASMARWWYCETLPMVRSATRLV